MRLVQDQYKKRVKKEDDPLKKKDSLVEELKVRLSMVFWSDKRVSRKCIAVVNDRAA
jgi:hypothetical protein